MQITQIKLTQIRDTYKGNVEVLRSLALQIKSAGVIPEIITVTKAPEFSQEFQLYLPTDYHAYLIQACNLAFSDPWKRKLITLYCAVLDTATDKEIAVYQSIRNVRQILDKGDAEIRKFAALVNSAEIEP